MSAAVERALSAVRTIRASGATAREVAGVGASARRSYDAGVRVARLEAMVSPIASIAVQGAFLAVLGVGGYRVASGSISVADLVAFILYLFLLVMPLGRVIGAWTQLQTGLGALARIQEILALAPGARRRPGARHARLPVPRRPGRGRRRSAARARRRLVRLRRRARRCCAGSPCGAGRQPGRAGRARRGRGSRRSWPWSRASTRCRRARSAGRAPTSASCRGRRCVPSSATSSRRRRSWPGRSATTCCSPGPTPPTPSCGRCWPTSG